MLVSAHKPDRLPGLDSAERAAAPGGGRHSWRGAPRIERVGLEEGLRRVYAGDAHAFPYDVVDRETGEPLPRAPRVNQGGLATLREAGYDLRYEGIWFDIDAPNHGVGADVAAFRNDVLKGATSVTTARPIWYQSRGGVRLVFLLPEPIGPERYERLWLAFAKRLVAAGVPVDMATRDRGRCYRLAFVRRDGEDLRLPADFDGTPLAPAFLAALLRVARGEEHPA